MDNILQVMKAQGNFDALSINRELESIKKNNNQGFNNSTVFSFLDTIIKQIGPIFSGSFLDRLHKVKPTEEQVQLSQTSKFTGTQQQNKTAGHIGTSINTTFEKMRPREGELHQIGNFYYLSKEYLDGFFEKLNDEYKPLLKLGLKKCLDSFFSGNKQAQNAAS